MDCAELVAVPPARSIPAIGDDHIVPTGEKPLLAEVVAEIEHLAWRIAAAEAHLGGGDSILARVGKDVFEPFHRKRRAHRRCQGTGTAGGFQDPEEAARRGSLQQRPGERQRRDRLPRKTGSASSS